MGACSVCERYPCPGCLGAAFDRIAVLESELAAANARVEAGTEWRFGLYTVERAYSFAPRKFIVCDNVGTLVPSKNERGGYPNLDEAIAEAKRLAKGET